MPEFKKKLEAVNTIEYSQHCEVAMNARRLPRDEISTQMAAKIAKVSYDPDEDILYVRLDKPIKDSLQHGDFIIDFSKDDQIVGLEIHKASKQLFAGLPADIDIKKSLSSVKPAFFGVREVRGIVWIGVAYRIEWHKRHYSPSLQVSVPETVLR